MTWVAIVPVSMNSAPLTGTFYTGGAPTAGYDTGSPGGTFTAWSGVSGVYYPNYSGNVWLWYYCAATGAGVTQLMVGEMVAGQVVPVGTTRTIAATESGYLGPLSPQTYNQTGTSITAFSTTPLAGALPAGAAGCTAVCFTTTTTLSVRAYTMSGVQP